MRLDYFLISFVVFSVIVLSFVQLTQEVRTNYNITSNPNDHVSSTFNTLDQMSSISAQQKNATLVSPLSDTDASTSMMTGAYATIKQVGYMFPLVQSISTDMCGMMPGMGSNCSMYVTAIVVVITISLIFSIVVMVLRAFVIQ
jgi:hypothetical protein